MDVNSKQERTETPPAPLMVRRPSPIVWERFGSFDSFPAEAPSANTRFICFDSALHEKGYDSEGEQVHYDPISLDDDPDEFMEAVTQSTPPLLQLLRRRKWKNPPSLQLRM